MEDKIINSIEIAFDEIKYQTNAEYVALYYIFDNEKLQLIFSTLHEKIMSCFQKMNTRLPSTEEDNYYWAGESGTLKHSIELALELQKKLKNSSLSFEIDEYYADVFTECIKFLKSSGGSIIPIGMEKIEIYKTIPIFKKSDFIKNSKTNIEHQLKNIGCGSYAKVFKYYDEFYQCDFALKRLNEKANAKEIERFLKEFETMKSINNPYILKVYSLNKDRNEYIMEYADFTLEKYINQNNSKLLIDEKISLGCQIIRGIEILWNKKILHRDISFKNILLKIYDDIYPVVKISDFGLIKEIDSQLTSENTEVKGSLNEISRLQKKGFKNYDTSDEIYALSRVLYFVATGKTNMEKAKCNFLQKATDENIENRYKNLNDLRKDFVSFLKNRT
ncbi:protein kinase family protein [Campylobacter peloridis]|uniref:Protein kinase family protein n=1 Tax=Campylobacter peloridis TaxID=488546 RepID=A0ABX6TTL9_9BACT|nr:protein kinase family protein [Campylobacter peloridis]AJC85365.1 protein kinase [Campylobacter peloridis LMG 23910]QOQ89378.1 protein kinase family protein [Campylobacter peloridis]